MFGSKNKENLEKIETLSKELEYKDEVFQAVTNGAKSYEANMAEYLESANRMSADLTQISENMDASGAILSENGKRLSNMYETLKVQADGSTKQREDRDAFLTKLDQTAENCMNAVENNKHFTGLSKSMTDFADGLRREHNENDRELKLMAEFSKQMSVLALNAAIDAGRMGDAGKQFMTSAESIRSYAANYDNAVHNMQERLDKSEKKIQELDEDVKKLIALLKDSNVAVTKLMKELNELSKEGRRLQKNESDALFAHLLNVTAAIHDAEGEVDRIEARNRMQMEDVIEEATLQKKDIEEIGKIYTPIVDLTK